MSPTDLRELGVVKTASPCDRKWENMQGSPVKRFCTDCQLYVWNFEELDTDAARELLLQADGRLCARIFTRADGTVLTRDCPKGLARIKRRMLAPVVAVGAWLFAAAVGLLGLFRAESSGYETPGWLKPVEQLRSANARGQRLAGKLVCPPKLPPPPRERPPPTVPNREQAEQLMMRR